MLTDDVFHWMVWMAAISDLDLVFEVCGDIYMCIVLDGWLLTAEVWQVIERDREREEGREGGRDGEMEGERERERKEDNSVGAL